MFFCEFADTALVARRGVGQAARSPDTCSASSHPPATGTSISSRSGTTPARSGWAWRLYEQFAAVAAQRGATALKAITSPENQGSVAFHRRLGFTEMTLQPDYQGSGRPRVVMRRPLKRPAPARARPR